MFNYLTSIRSCFKGSLSNCSAETKTSFAFIFLKCFIWDAQARRILLISGGFSSDATSSPEVTSELNIKVYITFLHIFLHFFFFLILEDLMKCTEHVILSNMNLQRIHKIFDDCVRKRRNVRDSSAVHISSILAAEMVSIEKSTMIWFKRWRWLNAKLCGTSLKTIIKQNYSCAHPIPNFQLQRRKPHKFPILHAIYWKNLIYKDCFLVVYF